MSSSAPYLPHRPGRSRFVDLRGLRCHLNEWGDAGQASADRPTLVMLHGWMDVGASFQFAVDALAAIEGDGRHVIAPDWRGFGLSDPGGADGYWFPDYLGDLDALLDSRADPAAPIDLLGHSMGGNVAMVYAGVRPERIRRLVNLEGFGLPATRPAQAPARYRQWLDELKQPVALRPYDSLDAVADRLRKTNPLLRADRAAWLAGHWSRQADDGRWHILGDPAHKRANPVLYQKDEVLACWQRIAAAAVGRGRPHRRRQVVGRPLPAQRLRRPPRAGAAGRAPGAVARRAHAAPRPAGGTRRPSGTLPRRRMTTPRSTGPSTDPPRGCGPAWGGPPFGPLAWACRACENPAIHRTHTGTAPWTSNTSMPSATPWPT